MRDLRTVIAALLVARFDGLRVAPTPPCRTASRVATHAVRMAETSVDTLVIGGGISGGDSASGVASCGGVRSDVPAKELALRPGEATRDGWWRSARARHHHVWRGRAWSH